MRVAPDDLARFSAMARTAAEHFGAARLLSSQVRHGEAAQAQRAALGLVEAIWREAGALGSAESAPR